MGVGVRGLGLEEVYGVSGLEVVLRRMGFGWGECTFGLGVFVGRSEGVGVACWGSFSVILVKFVVGKYYFVRLFL